jgi:hypothetical protein
MNQEHIETMKHVGDGVSVLVVAGALASVLPPIAAFFTIVWTAIRIYETKTVQRLLGRISA